MNLTNVVEAILFASGTRVSRSFILEKFPEIDPKTLDGIIKELSKKYSEESGIILINVAGELQLCTNPKYSEYMEVLMRIRDQKVSKTLLETLSIIAYAQPITRGDIEKMRGVSCDYAIMKLQQQKLIEVKGTGDSQGRPLLFGTTKDFLVKFGLESLDELPSKESLQNRIQELKADYESKRSLFTEKPMEEDVEYEAGTEGKYFDVEMNRERDSAIDGVFTDEIKESSPSTAPEVSTTESSISADADFENFDGMSDLSDI